MCFFVNLSGNIHQLSSKVECENNFLKKQTKKNNPLINEQINHGSSFTFETFVETLKAAKTYSIPKLHRLLYPS